VADRYGFIPGKIEAKVGMLVSPSVSKQYGIESPFITVESRKETAPRVYTWVASDIHKVVDQEKFQNFKDMITDHERIRQRIINES
jgi:hypothetical protein